MRANCRSRPPTPWRECRMPCRRTFSQPARRSSTAALWISTENRFRRVCRSRRSLCAARIVRSHAPTMPHFCGTIATTPGISAMGPSAAWSATGPCGSGRRVHRPAPRPRRQSRPSWLQKNRRKKSVKKKRRLKIRSHPSRWLRFGGGSRMRPRESFLTANLSA